MGINNRKYIEQIKDYTGMVLGSITPTDIDYYVEFKDLGFVFAECKYKGSKLPYGQRLALERLCKATNKPSILFVVEHTSSADIVLARTVVREYYVNSKWHISNTKDWLLPHAVLMFVRYLLITNTC